MEETSTASTRTPTAAPTDGSLPATLVSASPTRLAFHRPAGAPPRPSSGGGGVAAEVFAIDRQRGVSAGVDRALGIVAPVSGLDAHVLDIFRTIVGVIHQTDLADFLGPRYVGAFAEIDQSVIPAAH